jgi:hypothetical protein
VVSGLSSTGCLSRRDCLACVIEGTARLPAVRAAGRRERLPFPRSGTIRVGIEQLWRLWAPQLFNRWSYAPAKPLAARAAGRFVALDALAARSHVGRE